MTAPFTLPRLWLLGLAHYWRTNLAICLGVIVGTAVIGGALIVGDSVRASLTKMTLDRLGHIDAVLTGHRFFREDLAGEIAQQLAASSPDWHIAPAMILVGAVEQRTGETSRRAGRVTIGGVDAQSWSVLGGEAPTGPSGTEAVINEQVAHALHLKAGDAFTVWLELPSAVPRDTLLGKRDNDSQEISLTVRSILPDTPGPARFGLMPTQQMPFNVFVDLATLQDALDLAAVKPSKRDPVGSPGRVNTLFVQQPAGKELGSGLADALSQHWQLADLHLRIVHDETLNVLSVESEQMLLETKLADAVLASAKEQSLATSPVMVYLANSLKNAKDPTKFSMYSTVAGLDVLELRPPFGPFAFVGEAPASCGPRDVLINEFLAEDLHVTAGDEIRLAYHQVGAHGELPEEERTFTVRGVLKLEGPAADRQLTPTVKGITDADSLDEWDQPFPMKLDEVTPRDDEYWDSYRATPKVFLPLAAAQELWPSRYGTLTSIRVVLPLGDSVDQTKAKLAAGILKHLQPDDVGFAFQAIRADGLRAARGANDFSGLFFGFSLFLILAALILIGLLFRLSLEQRVTEWGLLGALGFSERVLKRLATWDGFAMVVFGGVLGAIAAIVYAQVMLYGLKTWWIGAIGTKFLILSIQPLSVLIGVLIAGLTSLAVIAVSRRRLSSVGLRSQLAGSVIEESSVSQIGKRRSRTARWAILSGAISLLMVLSGLLGLLPNGQLAPGLSWPVFVFMTAGLLLLACGIWTLSAWLQTDRVLPVRGRGTPALARLGLRNAARQRQRSVLTVAMVATAAFLITAVAAGRTNPTRDQPDRNSGNGGYTLVAESSSPLLYDLNTPDGRAKFRLEARTDAERQVLDQMTIEQFRVRPGEDASCLNLFQTTSPTLLGAPRSFLDRGGFAFAAGSGSNPWLKLLDRSEDGTIPVFGDLNTLMFGLKKGVGDVIELSGSPVRLRVAGMLSGSVFQGVLVMAEGRFLEAFPDRKGYQYFLADVPLAQAATATELLESRLAPYGFDAEPIGDRLTRFLAVQNTYLATFQALGGMGLLLGTLGLATVMLRNVLERRGELALLRAIGFRPGQVASLVFFENLWLLLWGLLVGSLAAILAMSPHLMTTGADVPWLSVAGLLLTVALVGLSAAALAIRVAVRVPILSTLRGE